MTDVRFNHLVENDDLPGNDGPRVDPAVLPFVVQPTGPVHLAATGATTNSASSSGSGDSDVDWSLVAALRAQASELLSQATAGDPLDRAGEEELGRSIVLDLIEAAMAEDANAGRGAWPLQRQRGTASAVFDSLFRLGRLQPLVDAEDVENVIIIGSDNVLVEHLDTRLSEAPAVADSDEELIGFLQFLATRSEVNARDFSEAHPSLHLRLDGGARLAALAWVTPRPSVVIRRHRLLKVSLDDLVAKDLMTDVAASFLAAAVKARKSIVVAGAQGAGKTTLMRALCAELDPYEAIVTIETEYELHLHQLPEQHRIVHAIEARPGSGERGADGRVLGEYTLHDALTDSFRLNVSRQIIGEVRGKEIWPMIKAMESGTGSLCTTHATSAEATIDKLITCAMEEGKDVDAQVAARKLAATVDLIVHIDLRTITGADGERYRQRRVAEIVAVDRGEKDPGYAITHVFAAPRRGDVAVPGTLPDSYRELEDFGFDLSGYLAAQRGIGHRRAS